jgi:hypothetical protein
MTAEELHRFSQACSCESLDRRNEPGLRVLGAVDALKSCQRERLPAHGHDLDVEQLRQRRQVAAGGITGKQLRPRTQRCSSSSRHSSMRRSPIFAG